MADETHEFIMLGGHEYVVGLMVAFDIAHSHIVYMIVENLVMMLLFWNAHLGLLLSYSLMTEGFILGVAV